MSKAITASLQTDQGQVRSRNEDAIAYWEPTSAALEQQYGWLYIVADGVGGADAGDVASRYAADQAVHHYSNDTSDGPIEARLRHAVQAANNDLRQLVKEEKEGTRMATTMVAAVIHENLVYMANVGDSRGYLWRQGMLRQITKDQSLVAKLVEEGAITPEEALRHPHRNVILSSLGGEDKPQIDIFIEHVEDGDRLLLCSDGLTRYLADDELLAEMGGGDLNEITSTFIAQANERGGADNISTIVVAMDKGEMRSAKEATPMKAQVKTEGKAGTTGLQSYTALLALVEIVLITAVWWRLAL